MVLLVYAAILLHDGGLTLDFSVHKPLRKNHNDFLRKQCELSKNLSLIFLSDTVPVSKLVKQVSIA